LSLGLAVPLKEPGSFNAAEWGKKAAKPNPDQREMLLPIAGGGAPKEAAEKQPQEGGLTAGAARDVRSITPDQPPSMLRYLVRRRYAQSVHRTEGRFKWIRSYLFPDMPGRN
jgi:hypothetical protein